MIKTIERGDIFSIQTEWLVCPVNRVGVMGAGLALAFANRFPGLRVAYERACREFKFEEANMFFYRSPARPDKIVVCFPSKRHWKNHSLLADIDDGLRNLAHYADVHQPNGVALPMVGCGYGGLDPEVVMERMVRHLEKSSTMFYILN